MEHTIRKPKATDIFVVSKIIKGIGIKNIASCFDSSEIKEMAKSMLQENEQVDENGNKTHKEFTNDQMTRAGLIVMTNIGELILDKMDVVQVDLIKFISNLTGLKVKEVEDLPITDFAEIVMAIIKEPDFMDFIKVVLKSFK